MKRLLMLLVLLLSFTNLCIGTEIPNDHNKPYLTVIGSDSDPRFATLKQWFDHNGDLKRLKAQTHFNVVPTDSAHYTDRLAPSFPVTPTVALQSPDGQVLTEFRGDHLPMSADALANGLRRQLAPSFPVILTESKGDLCRRDRRDQDIAPPPSDEPMMPPMPAPTPATPNHFPFLLLGILAAIAGCLGLAKGWHDTYYRS